MGERESERRECVFKRESESQREKREYGVCVCEGERERNGSVCAYERERCESVCVRVCVCVRGREIECMCVPEIEKL